jgi:hypothetical protein
MRGVIQCNTAVSSKRKNVAFVQQSIGDDAQAERASPIRPAQAPHSDRMVFVNKSQRAATEALSTKGISTSAPVFSRDNRER